MWCSAVLLISFLVSAINAATTPISFNCAPSKPGTCLLKSLKVLERDTVPVGGSPSTEREVAFEGSQLEYLPEALFRRFPQLESLHAKQIGLRKLGDGTFGSSPNLKYVDISMNSVGVLPDRVFGTCQQLEVINVAENKLRFFNGIELIGCAKLRQLNVSSNQLIYLNWDPLDDLRQLESVDLSNNLVAEITVPKYLRKIVARNNHIHKLSAESGSFIFMLEHLDVSRNRLSNVDALTRFAKLTYIDLSYNRLLKLDLVLFRNMASLRYLKLDHNNIFTLRSSVSKIVPLSIALVDLSHNELTTLTALDCAGISSTEQLLLSGNYLVSFEVTKGVGNFPRLQSISLDGNDWACRDLETTLAELKVKKVVVSSGIAKCDSYQIAKEGLCCRDLGTSFEELVLLKSEKLAEIQRGSSVTPKPTPAPSVTKAISTASTKIQATTVKPGAAQPSAPSKQTELQLAQLTAEKATLKAALERAQNDIKTLNEKLARCKTTFSQRTGQAVIID